MVLNQNPDVTAYRGWQNNPGWLEINFSPGWARNMFE